MHKDFFTFSEYMKKEDKSLTASMEDYLEMIYRLSRKTGFVRLHELSDALNVQPPSATKMVQKLAELNLINYEKYGVITLGDSGKVLGERLIKRHNIISDFLRAIDVTESEILEETEKIEHTISANTLDRFNGFIEFLNYNPDIKLKLKSYMESKQKSSNKE
ncbi:iron (metal) dependent repressor, DtxR family [Thermoanaerobacterium sp. RBIITD]|nr:transcriptional regulator MntR [Thermoanaerobacterium sp. RBIITD]SNX54019.1 iron (metal) dependent repressor, DtxR family [Thermoanaerobacterium sp. RBIITD]